MNILIYVPEIEQGQGGVRQYSVGLIRILAQDLSNKYFIYHNSNDSEIVNLLKKNSHLVLVRDTDVNENFIKKKIIHGKKLVNAISRRINRNVVMKIMSVIDRLIDKFDIDIVHCPYQFIPVTKKAKLIVTQHDVQEIHFPGFFNAEDRACRAVQVLDSLRRADGVVVSYNHIKDDLIKYFSVPATMIQVILLDMGKLWFEQFSEKDILHLNSLALASQFVLYPANTWEHKNHNRLFQAVALLRDKYGYTVNVVCSGHPNKYYEDVLKNTLEEFKLQNQVRFVGIVNEQTLFSLYRKCVGVVVPTVYEAGSFPLMESILLKVPVVCSNVTSLPETIENEEFLFNPFDVENIANKIKQIWISKDFRNRSIVNSEKVAWKIRHNNALNKFLNMYDSLDYK